MPSGYECSAQQGETRLGDQDQARRRGGRTEGLGESRQGGRGRGADREGLGPVRQRRPRRGSGQSGGQAAKRSGRSAERGGVSPGDEGAVVEQLPAETVEEPRTDEQGVSVEGREQPVIESQ